ncbi:troponin T, skeletal muscle-like [Macadamia integrifolia]|uniref:troponin T, skeletal muscle-like n=1 Tax=Macadamia integrifolia TaxID=60698 RepID=UPI001C4F73B9|nr:troponin T, skeletal muscle-like [Macadamia integrifolia]
METPASMRRITRSQALTATNNIPTSRKSEQSEKKSQSRQRNLKSDKSALNDITNDSPIVGLAGGSLETPSSFAKKRNQPKKTPGSGEALLRGQVKTLLQKVEEEAEFSKFCVEHLPSLHLSGALGSPSGLLAPTPANTPQIPNLSCGGDIKNILNGSASEMPSSNVDEESKIPQAVMDIEETKQDSLESVRNVTIRSLLFDFSEKSEISDSSECSSALTYQGETHGLEKSVEEDDASVWSIQVNASTIDEDEDGEEIVEGEEAEGDDNYYEEEEEGEEEEEEEVFDQLCEGLSKMIVQEKRMPEFKGKHTRFVYNNDDEIEGAEEVSESISPEVLRLNGLPTPKGKHLRFHQEEEED